MSTESTALRWIVAIVLALALVGLVAYARGDDSDAGRSPEREDSAPALVQGP